MRYLVGLLVLIGGAGYVATAALRPVAPAATTAATQAPAATRTGDVTVELSEAALTRQLSAAVVGQSLGETPLGPATAREVEVSLHDGAMRTTGTADVGGASVPVVVTNTIAAQDGRVVVGVRDATVAGVPVPDAQRQELQQVIQKHVDQALAKERLRVRSATVGEGKLIVVGTPT